MFILILFAFLAGIVTILSPCILPILPIVLSSSMTGGRHRPIGIVFGFIASFTFFTLALATIVRATHLPPDALHTVAVVLIFLFGVSLVLPQTQVVLEKLFSRLAGLTPKTQNQTGFFGGLLVGLSLGLIWAPCVGPILASVITLAVASQISLAAVLITLAYAIGTGIPMLGITYGGRQALQKVPWLLKNSATIQRAFGVVMIILAVAIYFNVDRQFQTWVLAQFPQYGTGLTAIEENSAVQNQLQQLHGGTQSSVSLTQDGPAAPDFTGGTNWINSPPLSLQKELKGKVVLVDFWTYSCINCLRTLPYLRQWYQTYKDQGFVIVGVHSPEFEFEKVTANVQKATQDLQVSWPVVQDNNFTIWNAYNNQYWPAHYLINKDGKIVYTHFGEGNYVETENAIRTLLNQPVLNKTEAAVPQDPLTPETYLGYGRADAYTNDNQIQPDQSAQYQFPGELPNDAVGLSGTWQIAKESIVAKAADASLSLNFAAHQVYLVMDKASDASGTTVKVQLDGQPLPKKYWTKDMNANGEIVLDMPRKYDVLNLGTEYGRHTVTLIFPAGGEAFAFTFG